MGMAEVGHGNRSGLKWVMVWATTRSMFLGFCCEVGFLLVSLVLLGFCCDAVFFFFLNGILEELLCTCH